MYGSSGRKLCFGWSRQLFFHHLENNLEGRQGAGGVWKGITDKRDGGGKGRSVLVMAEGLWGIGNIGVLKKYRY